MFVVDDSGSDVSLFTQAIHERSQQIMVRSWLDAVEFRDFVLSGKEPHTLPSLIVLDLCMPGVDGVALTECLRESDVYCEIPVLILTSSSDKRSVQRAYSAKCSGYVVKPLDPREFVDVVQKIYDYWITCNVPPCT